MGSSCHGLFGSLCLYYRCWFRLLNLGCWHLCYLQLDYLIHSRFLAPCLDLSDCFFHLDDVRYASATNYSCSLYCSNSKHLMILQRQMYWLHSRNSDWYYFGHPNLVLPVLFRSYRPFLSIVGWFLWVCQVWGFLCGHGDYQYCLRNLCLGLFADLDSKSCFHD